MPIESIDSNFPLESVSSISGVARVGTGGNGGNRRNPAQSDPQEQAGGEEERAKGDAPVDIEEAATITLSAASLELEGDVAPSEVMVYDGVEDEPVSLINEMA